MVHKGSGAGSGEVVGGVCEGGGVAVAGVGDSVCGLCGVAAGVVARGDIGRAVEVLERTVKGCAGTGDADGPSAAGSSESPRSGRTGADLEGSAEGVEWAGRDDAVHGVVGRFSGDVEPVQRAGRCGGRYRCSEPDACGAGGVDWIFREPVGAASGFERRPECAGDVTASTGSMFGGVCASGFTVRAAGRGFEPEAGSESGTVVSGEAGIAERSVWRTADGRAGTIKDTAIEFNSRFRSHLIGE